MMGSGGQKKSQRSEAGDLQRRVLRVVRSVEQCTVRDVHERLLAEGPIAYTTVQTVMTRLAQQGALVRHKERNTGIFRAAFSTDRARASKLADDLVAGFGPLAVTEFLDKARAQPELMDRLRELLDPPEADSTTANG